MQNESSGSHSLSLSNQQVCPPVKFIDMAQIEVISIELKRVAAPIDADSLCSGLKTGPEEARQFQRRIDPDCAIVDQHALVYQVAQLIRESQERLRYFVR